MEPLTVIGYVRQIQPLLKQKSIPQSITHTIFAFYYHSAFIRYILRPTDNDHLYTDDCKKLYQYILNTLLSDYKRLLSTNNNSRLALQYAIALPLKNIVLCCKPLHPHKIYQKRLFYCSLEYIKLSINKLKSSDKTSWLMNNLQNLRDNIIENIPTPKEILNINEQYSEFTEDIHKLLYSLATIDSEGIVAKISDRICSSSTNNRDNGYTDLDDVCKWSWAIGVISGSLSVHLEERILVSSIKVLLNMCVMGRSKEKKIVIAVVRKYPRILSKHQKFLYTVILKLFEFMMEKNSYIKNMAISSLHEIFLFDKCSKMCLESQSESGIFLYELMEYIANNITQLNLNSEQSRKLCAALEFVIHQEYDTMLQYEYKMKILKVFQLVSQKNDIQKTLISMGYAENYIDRAFEVSEQNIYDVEVMIEIIVQLQNKDIIKDKNANFKQHVNAVNIDEIKKLKQKIADMENNEKKMKDKLESLFDFTVNIDSMNEQQLDELENKLECRIKLIKEAKKKLIENQFYCIICLENKKNIIIHGCNHFDICDQCEVRLEPKICPRCQIAFTNVIKVRV
eukprot:75748_1